MELLASTREYNKNRTLATKMFWEKAFKDKNFQQKIRNTKTPCQTAPFLIPGP